MADGALLEVRDLHAWYGESHVLHGVDFEVRRGEVVTLLGRNGAGKTTTLKSVMGMTPRRAGSIRGGGIGAPSAEGAGWGGGPVVVRARERRAHGEGGQQVGSAGEGMPGGRR